RWTFDETSFAADARLILADADGQEIPQRLARHLGLSHSGLFIRLPVTVAPAYVISLIAIGEKPGKRPPAAAMNKVKTLIEMIAAEATMIIDSIIDDPDGTRAPLNLNSICARIANAGGTDILVDSQLQVVSASRAARQLLDRLANQSPDNPLRQPEFPFSDALRFYCQQALATRITPPEIEVVVGEKHERRVYAVLISPLRPVDATEDYLHAYIRDVTARSAVEERLARLARRRPAMEDTPEPSLAFLQKTLVEKRTLRSRKNLTYLTLRSWRRPIREFQIDAMKALKANLPPAMPTVIADDMIAHISTLIGANAFKAVVPVPCGHSRQGPCLSLEIARAIGQKLSIPVIQAFESQPMKGSSHPKENKRRPAMLMVRTVSDSVLLVDDIATSGAHLAEAAALLRRSCTSLLAIAWIGGDAP
ncbi:MAG: hypothetical protein ACRCYS_12465, partial [Beijerinckiaceae bacterium]